MRRLLAMALALCLCAASVADARATRAGRARPRIRVAITLDDLPAVGGSDLPGWTKARILDAIVDTLRAHHVTEVVGFFNGTHMDDDPATRAAVEKWLSSGFVLGNHTFSHDSASEVGASAFERDIARDQAVIAELEGDRTPKSRYFRYPYLERGHAHDARGIREYLLRHRYRIADVSVDFEDWAFSAAYARCATRGDQPTLRALSESYLTSALAELHWAVEAVKHVVGRPVPQVLLVHANLMTARMLDALLSAYEQAGVQFVALDEALNDSVYAQAQTDRHGDTGLILALVRERRAHLHSFAPLPGPTLDALCK